MTTRVAKKPIPLPTGVEVRVELNNVIIKGAKGQLKQPIYPGVTLKVENNVIFLEPPKKLPNRFALTGTMRSLINNGVIGVSQGFTKKLQLFGVGYRAQAGKAGQRAKLGLTLGLSHPVEYLAPEGISLETPSATEIIVTGIDKQLVGQVAADIRSICKGIRKPEPYKGKGIRYHDEHIIMKETKKK